MDVFLQIVSCTLNYLAALFKLWEGVHELLLHVGYQFVWKGLLTEAIKQIKE